MHFCPSVTATLNCDKPVNANYSFLCWQLLTLKEKRNWPYSCATGEQESDTENIFCWDKNLYLLVERYEQVGVFFSFFPCRTWYHRVQLDGHGGWEKRLPQDRCRWAPGTISENHFQSRTHSQNLRAEGTIRITLQSD